MSNPPPPLLTKKAIFRVNKTQYLIIIFTVPGEDFGIQEGWIFLDGEDSCLLIREEITEGASELLVSKTTDECVGLVVVEVALLAVETGALVVIGVDSLACFSSLFSSNAALPSSKASRYSLRLNLFTFRGIALVGFSPADCILFTSQVTYPRQFSATHLKDFPRN